MTEFSDPQKFPGEPQPTNPQGDAGQAQGQNAGAGAQGGAGAEEQRQWYYAVSGQSYGPVSEKELVSLAKNGYFKKDDYVYAAYLGDWVRADSVHGLFDTVGAAGETAAGGEVYIPGAAAPPGQTTYAEYAGFWIRFVAVFIDGLVLMLPNCLISGLMQGVLLRGMSAPFGRSSPMPTSATVSVFAVTWAAQMVIPWLYYGFMESSSWQATLGKRAVGIMVTDIYGQRISFGRATGRYFASMLSGIILSIGYIIGAFTERKQTLHDMIVNTVVIYGRTD